MDDGGGGVLVPCDVCGRKFAPEAMQRHRPICARSSQKQRKVFDSSKQRAEGTDIPTVKKKGGGGPPRRTDRIQKGPISTGPQSRNEVPVKKNNWRAKHEDFVNTIRAARGLKVAMERGGPLPPPPPPSLNPDYIQCDYCGRRFNETAAQRHIDFCRDQHDRLPRPKANQFASQKQATRTQYQPPKIKKTVGYGQDSMYDTLDSGGDSYGSRGSGGQRGGYTSVGGGRVGIPASRGAVRGGVVRGGGTTRMTTMGSGYGSAGRPGSGEALRTGRTAQTYEEARQLSAKQRATMAPQARRVTSNDNINSSQYTGTGYTSSYAPAGSSGYGNSSTMRGAAPRTGTRPAVGSGGGVSRGSYGAGSYNTAAGSRGRNAAGQPPSGGDFANRFCMDCGAKYPSPVAKFCGDCGSKKS